MIDMTTKLGTFVANGQVYVARPATNVAGIITVRHPILSAKIPIEIRPVAATPLAMTRK